MPLWPTKPLPADRGGRLSRRPILIYLMAIVGPTLALLYLGLQSVERQYQAIATLTQSNLRLSGERLAAELARRTEHLAELCLRDPDLAALRLPAVDDERPEPLRPVRDVLQQVKARHPIAELFVVLQGNGVRYPRLETPPPRQLENYLVQEEPGRRLRFAQLFEEAERLELQLKRPADALTAYRRSAELPVSGTLKAVALARVARCARKANQPEVAEQAYRALRDAYGDVYDLFHRPFALVAGLELADLPGGERSSSAEMDALASDLLRGRWELSAEQFDYYRAQIAERLHKPVGTVTSAHARELEAAGVLQDNFRLPRSLRAGELYPYAVVYGDQPYQTYSMPASPGAGEGQIVVLAVDLNWIEHQLLPQAAADLGMDTRRVALAPVTTSGSRTPTDTRVAFPTVFPFWELSLASARPGGWWWGRETLAIVGSTLAVLGVLVLGVILLMRDASRQLQLGQVRTDFVSGVSHELKTPLTLIRLYAETLSDSPQIEEKERREYYEIITRESERLTQLIERVLDFARIDRGQEQYRLSEGDLAAIVAHTVGPYAAYLRRRGFTVEADLAADLPPVRFDPDAVTQAVVNLLDNAAKYSGDAKFVGVQLRTDHERVVFEVEDRGVGIATAEQPKIFEQFYRSGGSSGKGGYGLGLFLVKHVMDAHGGQIELESEIGRGSCFRLLFPIELWQRSDRPADPNDPVGPKMLRR